VRFQGKQSTFVELEVEFEVTGDHEPPITSGPPDNWDPGSYQEDGRSIMGVFVGTKPLPRDLVEKLAPFLQAAVDAVPASRIVTRPEREE
jgi:hypothetical protein